MCITSYHELVRKYSWTTSFYPRSNKQKNLAGVVVFFVSYQIYKVLELYILTNTRTSFWNVT